MLLFNDVNKLNTSASNLFFKINYSTLNFFFLTNNLNFLFISIYNHFNFLFNFKLNLKLKNNSIDSLTINVKKNHFFLFKLISIFKYKYRFKRFLLKLF